jgi:hypothetical protein
LPQGPHNCKTLLGHVLILREYMSFIGRTVNGNIGAITCEVLTVVKIWMGFNFVV